MGLLGVASEKQQFELTPVAEYVWTLWDLVSETGQYGEQVKWVWLISPVNDPDAYILRADGKQEKEIWQFTKPSLAKGSRARQWAEALMGREIKNGEDPDDNDLIRRRMVAMLVHKPKKSDPTVRNEAISEEMPPRPFQAARPADQVRANPTDADVDALLAASDELRKRVRKLVRNASLDDITELPKWGELDEVDLSNLADGDLQEMERDIKAAMRAAA